MAHIRPVRPSDLELICDHRRRMFEEAGRDAADLDAMAAPFRAWLAARLADGAYFGFIAEEDTIPIAGVGLMVIDWPPHPAHPHDGRRGYVLNVFVEPSHRGQGVAKALMARAEAEFRARGAGYLILHSTAQGRPLYESLGWSATSEMAKVI